MRWVWIGLGVATLMLVSLPGLHATVFGTVRGIVHDPQHRPIAGADVTLKSASSEWLQKTQTNSEGEFSFPAVPFGEYIVSAKASAFAELQQSFTLASDTSSILHLQLALASINEKVVVTAPEARSRSTSPPQRHCKPRLHHWSSPLWPCGTLDGIDRMDA